MNGLRLKEGFGLDCFEHSTGLDRSLLLDEIKPFC